MNIFDILCKYAIIYISTLREVYYMKEPRDTFRVRKTIRLAKFSLLFLVIGIIIFMSALMKMGVLHF